MRVLLQVRDGWDIPLNAVTVTLTLTVVFSFVIIGSPIAFSILTSIGLTGLMSSYIIAIACIAHRRLQAEPLPTSRFRLGNYGIVVNGVVIAFLLLACVMMFFPQAPHPEPKYMNWNIVVFSSVNIFSFSYYYFRGRHNYKAPVDYVRKDV